MLSADYSMLLFSNSQNRRSNSHCCCAFSLDFKNAAQEADGVSPPSTSFEHAAAELVKTSRSRHKPTPGRKLCSSPVRTICLRRERDVFTSSAAADRKSTRLNSSHQIISYAVFCLKK